MILHTQVGSYRLDSQGKLPVLRRYIQIWSHCQHIQVLVQIKYAGSEAHVIELLEKVCDNANDYATSTDDNGKCLEREN